LNNLANVARAQGRHDDARRAYARAVAILEPVVGPDHADVAELLTGLADSLLALGQVADARIAAERAVQILEAAAGSPWARGLSRFVLARILWSTRREQPRALALARAARDDLGAAGAGAAQELAEVEAWLAGR
jgi:eukaryotic-like serine/threonine-protein kinase